jgi:nicotinamide-nucleotide amidase
VGEHIYGYDKDTLQSVVGDMLRKSSATVSVAESCTGGTLARLITSVPGSSDYFRGGVIAYQNEIKQRMLGVSPALIEVHHVVSEVVACAMAKGAREALGSTYAIATSGIAGPGGGTDSHPVGLVCVAVAGPKGEVSATLRLGKRRENNMDMAAQGGLNLLRKEILKQKGEF